MKKKITINLSINWVTSIVIGLILGLSLQFVHAWTEPSSPPPNANIVAPITTSKIGQVKEGGLILNTIGAANGLLVQNGNVGIGTPTPASKLTVAGPIESTSGGIKFPDGTSQTTAATSMPSLLATNGYTKLPNGLIMQWGTSAPLDGSDGCAVWYCRKVIFPIPFPNAVLNVTATSAVGGTWVGSIYAYNKTKTNMILISQYIDAVAGIASATWIAIGY